MNKALEVKNNIHWVGSLDFNLRVFDIIMRSDYGTTYNSYVVKGEDKTVLFEISKEGFFDQFIERLGSVCDPKEIDYVVVNHTEPDHTGALIKLLEINPDLEIIASQSAANFLKNILNCDFKTKIVKEGDTVDLGGMTLNFISVPFLHWPDSIYTYIPEAKTLFSCDSFGCHYCDERVFNDLIGFNEGFEEAYKYYFDHIMGPFKSYVMDAIAKIKDLEIETICNGHGPVIRSNPQKYIDMYKAWATVEKPSLPRVLLPYLSAYGYTEELAGKVFEGLQAAGNIDVKMYNLVETGTDSVIKELGNASGIIIGSPTLLGDTLPPVWDILKSLNSNIHKGLLGGAFGSYGWSGEAVPAIEARFRQLRFKMPAEGLRVCFKSTGEDLQKAYELGKTFGEAVLDSK